VEVSGKEFESSLKAGRQVFSNNFGIKIKFHMSFKNALLGVTTKMFATISQIQLFHLFQASIEIRYTIQLQKLP
jgi:hypothetical protein